jgi:hypothetical protein
MDFKNSELSFGCRILNFFSSIRPEILAIFIIIPQNNYLTIYSNSHVMINGINTIIVHNNQKSYIYLNKITKILYVIKKLIKNKYLDLYLLKIKRHLGNRWNDTINLIVK